MWLNLWAIEQREISQFCVKSSLKCPHLRVSEQRDCSKQKIRRNSEVMPVDNIYNIHLILLHKKYASKIHILFYLFLYSNTCFVK